MALEKTFNVGEHGRLFEDYMHALRDALRDPREAPPLANHPDLHLLRPTTRREPPQWLHLTMETADRDASIVVWIRTDNLYVIGFEQVQGARRRFELGSDPKNDAKKKKDKGKEKKAKKKKEKEDETDHQGPLIAGATFLGFDGGYGDLRQLQAGPVPGRRTDPDLGWEPLEAAIRSLATYTPEAPGAVRDWLRTIVVTVSESLRLHNVCQFMNGLLREYRSGWLTQLMIDCIHNWGPISACVIASAADPEGDARGRYRHLTDVCENTEGACEFLAIINAGSADEDKPGPSHRPKREATVKGQTFVEIFSASAVVAQGNTTGRTNLYGHIAIDDGLSSGSSQLLFTRGRSNALPTTTSADDHVQLTGPARAAWGYGEIVMHVDLMDAVPGFVADMTPDDEVGSGKLVWNTYDTPRMVYDEVEEYVFEGVSGAVNVRCAVITNAVVATVVLRRTGSGTGLKDVYGTVSAATAMFGPQDKVTLFDRVWKDAVSVGAGEDVPLLRNVAVVPLRSSLMISADLWTRADVTDMSPDDRISSGAVAVFQSSPFGVVRKVIGGSDLEVSVTWSLN